MEFTKSLCLGLLLIGCRHYDSAQSGIKADDSLESRNWPVGEEGHRFAECTASQPNQKILSTEFYTTNHLVLIKDDPTNYEAGFLTYDMPSSLGARSFGKGVYMTRMWTDPNGLRHVIYNATAGGREIQELERGQDKPIKMFAAIPMNCSSDWQDSNQQHPLQTKWQIGDSGYQIADCKAVKGDAKIPSAEVFELSLNRTANESLALLIYEATKSGADNSKSFYFAKITQGPDGKRRLVYQPDLAGPGTLLLETGTDKAVNMFGAIPMKCDIK